MLVSGWSSNTSVIHRSRTLTQLSSTKQPTSSETSNHLSSAYDRNIPASMVGEAVRAAVRSDRGICFDFSTDRYAAHVDGNDNAGSTTTDVVGTDNDNGRLVSVVKMNGQGAKPFINAKFSQSVPTTANTNIVGSCNNNLQLSDKTQLVRKGYAFESAYLTSKGRTIDRLSVLAFPSNDKGEMSMEDAFLVTSPGNSGSALYNELSPLVFPMDKVKLTDCSSSSPSSSSSSSSSEMNVIILACSTLNDAQTSFNNNILNLLMNDDSYSQKFEFPTENVCHHYRVAGDETGVGTSTTTDVYMMQHTFLSSEICHGYTLLIEDNNYGDDGSINQPKLAIQIWDKLTNEQNEKGPVGVGSLEYDTLRVEAGLPGFGTEMTGDGPKKKKMDDESNSVNSDDDDKKYYAKASPLELHLQPLINTEKGCYQGQEGVASIMKNKRGPPRQLYQAVFYDIENDFDGDGGSGGIGLMNTVDNKELKAFQQMKKDADPFPNDTRQPRVGDDIYVLGSDESISVGKISELCYLLSILSIFSSNVRIDSDICHTVHHYCQPVLLNLMALGVQRQLL